MSETLMALGDYRFSINTAAYQELKHSQAYRWQSQERILRKPALQFMGEGEESMSFTDSIYLYFWCVIKKNTRKTWKLFRRVNYFF